VRGRDRLNGNIQSRESACHYSRAEKIVAWSFTTVASEKNPDRSLHLTDKEGR
jgi:hypothetical protein